MTQERYAIIGTAGRDKTKPMTPEHYKFMVVDAKRYIPKGAHVVSGGAAWADHVAVTLFLFGWASAITLHLPAPFIDGKFLDSGFKSAGGAANYYHRQFSQVIDRDTLGQIASIIRLWEAGDPRVNITYEAASPGIGGMFARNSKVAQCENMLAYTFGVGAQPADGGTLDTWNKCQGKKTHISLPIFRN